MNQAAENIGKKLTAIRLQGYREDPSDTPPLLYLLGYDGFRSPEQVEALLIKAIHHAIHNLDDQELLLMAFRLLKGYDDAPMKDIGDRRRRYVLEHKRLTKDEMIAYQAAGDDPDAKMAALKAACDRLRKEEDKLIVKLSNMLSVISDIDSYVEDIDDYTKCGYLYNWYAATAGTGTYATSTQGTNVSGSICPTGWRLPSAMSDGSTATGNGTSFTAADFEFMDNS